MKKTIKIIIPILLIIGIIIFAMLNISTETEQNVENENEIQPEEELIENQESETEIKLYYEDSTSGILTAQTKKIKAKELIENPYLYVLNQLLEEPTENKYKKTIPEGTKINHIELKKGTLKIDLSQEFLNSKGTNPIYSIVKTMSQFNEVENIKITINGKEEENLKQTYSTQE